MAAIFWSHANSYVGDYSIVRRTPHKEFTEGYHYHDFYEAQFYFNNDPETKDEPLGTIMLGDEMYKPKNGDVFLINMFDSHYIQMDNKKHYDRYCVSISPTLMLFICSEHSNLFNIYNKSNRNYPLMHMTEHQQQLFLQMYHDFEVEEGTGPVLLGEVSQCNDDNVDNRFYEKMGRFPEIEEDEAPYRLLCNEYPEAK